jgi:hypothetical protein
MNDTMVKFPYLVFETNWTIDEFIEELAAGNYFIKDYSDIAIGEIELRQTQNLRNMLEIEKINTKMIFHKRNFIPMLSNVNNVYTKYIDDICSLYHINQSTQHNTELKITKCLEYMSYSLLKHNEIIPGVSNYNWMQINLYIIKLGIEKSYLNNILKNLETKWNLNQNNSILEMSSQE